MLTGYNAPVHFAMHWRISRFAHDSWAGRAGAAWGAARSEPHGRGLRTLWGGGALARAGVRGRAPRCGGGGSQGQAGSRAGGGRGAASRGWSAGMRRTRLSARALPFDRRTIMRLCISCGALLRASQGWEGGIVTDSTMNWTLWDGGIVIAFTSGTVLARIASSSCAAGVRVLPRRRRRNRDGV